MRLISWLVFIFLFQSCQYLEQLEALDQKYAEELEREEDPVVGCPGHPDPIPEEPVLDGVCVIGHDGPCGGGAYCVEEGIFNFNPKQAYLKLTVFGRDNLNELDLIEQDLNEDENVILVNSYKTIVARDSLNVCLKEKSGRNQKLFEKLRTLKSRYDVDCVEVVSVNECTRQTW